MKQLSILFTLFFLATNISFAQTKTIPEANKSTRDIQNAHSSKKGISKVKSGQPMGIKLTDEEVKVVKQNADIISEIFAQQKAKELISASKLYNQAFKSNGNYKIPNKTILKFADEIIAKRLGANKATADGQFTQRSYDIILAALGILENNEPTTNSGDYDCKMARIELRRALNEHQAALQSYNECRNNVSVNEFMGMGSAQIQSMVDDLHFGQSALSNESACSYFENRVNDSINSLKRAVGLVKDNCG